MKKLFLLGVSLLNFSFAGDMEKFLNNLGIYLQHDKAIEAQKKGYWIGGGARWTTPGAVTLNPIRVVPPSIRAGCGGIDITFGGFEYLKNPDYFIDFAKQVVQVAPAFAFSTALETMCPQCASIMNKLTAIANQINAMGLNSCQTMANFSNWIKSEVLNHRIVSGQNEGWLSAVDSALSSVSDSLQAFNKFLTDLGCNNPDCFIFAGYDSIADRVISETLQPRFGINSTDTKILLRELFGDIYYDSSKGSVVFYSPKVEEITLIAEQLATQPTLSYSASFGQIFYGKTPYKYAKDNLDGIVTNILNKQPLTASQLQFLALYDIPALRLLNFFSISPTALLAVKEKLANYLAWELTYRFFQIVVSEYNRIMVKIQQMPVKEVMNMSKDDYERIIFWANNFPDRSLKLLEFLKARVDKEKQKIIADIKLMLDMFSVERAVLAKYSDDPVLASYIEGNLLKGGAK